MCKKESILKKERGSSLVASLMLLSLMGIMGAAAISMSSGENTASTNEMQGDQALYVGQAGIEYAKNKLDQGLLPDVNNKAFGKGTFTVLSIPASSQVMVTGIVGNAKKVQTINTNFSKNCVTLDTSAAQGNGQNLENIKLIKSCNTSATPTQVTVDWNWGSCTGGANPAVTASCEPTETSADAVKGEYDDYVDPDNSKKILICHRPPGNPENAKTHSVSIEGWESGHNKGEGYKHGLDTLGACETAPTVTPDTESDGCVSVDPGVGSSATLAQCDAVTEANKDRKGAYVTQMGLAQTAIYDISSSLGTPTSPGATGAETINTQDYVMVPNGTYNFEGTEESGYKIKFSKTLPETGWYKVTVDFADGSQLSSSFLAEQIQEAESNSATPAPPGGSISDPGTLQILPQYISEFKILGSFITWGANGPEIPVIVELGVVNSSNGTSYNAIYSGQDVDGGETHTVAASGDTVKYRMRATAQRSNFYARYDSLNTTQVKTLKHGDQAPPLAGFGGQKAVTAVLDPYLDETGKVVLASNQFLLLFELGVNMNNDPSSTAADFQDLVVLVTVNAVVQQEANTNTNSDPTMVDSSSDSTTDSSGDVYYKKVGDQLKK